jgi:transposase
MRETPSLEQRVAQLEAELVAAKSTIEALRRAYTRALEQLKLLRHRLYVAKAERADVAAEQLALDLMTAEVAQLQAALDNAEADVAESDGGKEGVRKPRAGHGRRKLEKLDLPVVLVELTDPELEGKAERIGVEESSRLGHIRGGPCRVVVSRVVYKVEPPVTAAATAPPDTSSAPPAPTFVTAPLPRELVRRGLLAPSMIAHILGSKYLLGVPFYRLEQQMALRGVPLDRGTMSRYAEDVGATLGAIVLAMRDEAMRTAFCLATDATGICIQPGPMAERKVPKRGPCRKGHFFVVLADRDHVFFEFQAKHTSVAVCDMFRGFGGYIQADAHAVYDALFRGTPPQGTSPEPSTPPPIEVGCWSHARTNFWEAAICKHPLGLEGLRRADLIFAADRLLKDLSPAQRKARREVTVRPLVDAFFAWVRVERAKVQERGLVATALGYALNQELPLRRFLDDGRLRLDNNASERALRAIAAARKSWMFFGSDDHASAAANIFSLVASCKLHRLDPEAYLTEVVRVMPYWPRDRYLELAPRYWAATHTRLDPKELARELGPITVPTGTVPVSASEQKTPTS